MVVVVVVNEMVVVNERPFASFASLKSGVSTRFCGQSFVYSGFLEQL